MNKLSILLADDDPDDSFFFDRALALSFPEAEFAWVNNGQKAIDYLTTCADDELPRVLVLDYNMPVANGAEVLDWMREKPRYKGIRKFMLSTAQTDQFRNSCLSKGALEYFIKPQSEESLQALIEEIARFALDAA